LRHIRVVQKCVFGCINNPPLFHNVTTVSATRARDCGSLSKKNKSLHTTFHPWPNLAH